MSREIPIGTVIENRYKITKTLGLGGFGRAYLAEDRNRYHEQCVLKEFAPDIDRQYWNKAKELFDRECSQLYQLQHDQIPAFRELLKTEVDNELYVFLVQNYVRGLNYHAIVQKYGVLNEGQIIYFLQQILPVLSYIHDENLIHRDISPDNLICRFEDQKPVLIDFGLVKQISQQYTQMAFTPAGKPWFSPSEQLQGQSATPSSDLHALAVTVLFLLTNQNLANFYTPRSGKWEFSQHVKISAGLTKILTKMLEFRPIDRYQTTSEVSQAIVSLPSIISVSIQIDPKDLDYIPPSPKPSFFTSSILALFRKADLWRVMKSDFAQPVKYIGGGLLGLLVAIVFLNSIVKGIGSAISSVTRPQPTSTSIPTDVNKPNLDACLNINKRLKAASISHEAVNKKYYKKYSDRPKKRIDPNNINDRQLRVEWCQVAETLVGSDR
jgi:serine/threonine protein kinase